MPGLRWTCGSTWPLPGGLLGALAEQWQGELYRRFQLPFEILTNDKLEAARTGNWFLENDPLVHSVVRSGNVITLSGHLAGAFLGLGGKDIEVYAAAPDPLGYGEGARYEGTSVTDSNGIWSLTFNDPAPGRPSYHGAGFHPGG